MKIVFLLYDGVTALDFVGPQEVLGRLPWAKVQRVARKKGTIVTDLGMKIEVDAGIDEVTKADILVVPGGPGTVEPEVLDWIREMHKKTKWTTSVCTGSLILGAAGLLKGKRATTHWAFMDRLPALGCKPVRKRVVEEGKIITSAGVSAGIDMALTLAAKVSSKWRAKGIQLGIEYDPAPPFDAGSVKKAPYFIRKFLKWKLKR